MHSAVEPTRAARRRPSRRRWFRLWLARADLFQKLEIVSALMAVTLGIVSYAVLTGKHAPAAGFSPPFVSLLLVANLVPLAALLVLIARRLVILVGNRRAGRAGARLHLQLVALFAGVAAVPTLLVVAFAALLFQYGVQFWFSDRARTVLENADRVAQAYVAENRLRMAADVTAMAVDVRLNAGDFGPSSRRFAEALAFQVDARNLSEAAVFEIAAGGPRGFASARWQGVPLMARITSADLARARGGAVHVITRAPDRIEALARFDPTAERYLYVTRRVDPKVLAQAQLSRSALADYSALIGRSETLQWRFNAMLIVVSLLLLAAVIWAALRLARRLSAPLAQMAHAAERVGAGDFSERVAVRKGPDELTALGRAFNRMTHQLEAQKRALVEAGDQIDARRRLTEAVLAGVSAGVLAIDPDGSVRMMNQSAATLLGLRPGRAIGQPLARVAPDLAALLEEEEGAAPTESRMVLIARGAETQTLAVRLVRLDRGDGGAVLTFDDISQQLVDQRRAAWSDVARRIAHEIKNPLTPIQLSAERLQRKFARQIAQDGDTFAELTSTIVRQVGDLRRMVDEFSSFARMPKPEFRKEPLAPIARQALILQEVAFPAIRFVLDLEGEPSLVCDRRQLAQALTNLLKNAAESVEARQERDGGDGQVRLAVSEEAEAVVLAVSDDGLGLPAEKRARLTEPYVTTRARGTGLGLAIVSKIVEEHAGTLELADAPGGGAVVRMRFDSAALDARAPAPALAAE